MKILQEIERLLDTEDGCIKLNKFCELKRKLVDEFENDVDVLRVEFKVLDGFCSFQVIKSRKPKKILKQIIKYQKKAFKLALKELNHNILEV